MHKNASSRKPNSQRHQARLVSHPDTIISDWATPSELQDALSKLDKYERILDRLLESNPSAVFQMEF